MIPRISKVSISVDSAVNSSIPNSQILKDKTSLLRERISQSFETGNLGFLRHKYTRIKKRINTKKLSNELKDNFVYNAINICCETSKNRQSKIALLDKVKKLSKFSFENYEISFHKKPLKVMERKGICMGGGLELAKIYLNQPDGSDEFEKTLKNLHKGFGRSAEDNQAVYESIKSFKPKSISGSIFEILRLAPQEFREQYLEPHELKDKDININNIWTAKGKIRLIPQGGQKSDKMSYFQQIKEVKDKYSNNEDFQPLLGPYELAIAFERLERIVRLGGQIQIKDPPGFILSQEALSSLPPNCKDCPMEQVEGGNFLIKISSDDMLNGVLVRAYREVANRTEYAVGKVLNIKIGLVDQLGSSAFYKTDQQYLENTKDMSPGFYMAKFRTKSGSHVVSIVSEPNGGGRIVDPNGLVLKYKSKKELPILLHKIINGQYLTPEGHTNHSIVIQKCEKISEIHEISKKSAVSSPD